MRFLSFYYGSIAVARLRFCNFLFRAFAMQVATTAPQTSRELLAVGPDMDNVLAVIVLRKARLRSV
jgi:hypothetical protein